MPQWTNEQRLAIEARNHTILVSAAAGSGKTAVLVERIITLLREGYRMDRMMIVTFTRAAAAEMRERLAQRIFEEARIDPVRMGPALDQLEQAEISTIHSFCQRVLREDFQAVGLDPLAAVCEEQTRRELFEQAYELAMNELLEDSSADSFHFLVSQVDLKDIQSWNDRLHTFLMALPHPFAWAKEKISHICDQPFTAQPWYLPLRDLAMQQLQGVREILSAERRILDQPEALTGHMVNWEADCAVHETFMAALEEHPEELQAIIRSYQLPRLKTVKVPGGKSPAEEEWEKGYKKLRQQHKDLIAEVTAFVCPDETALAHDLPVVQRLAEGLLTLTERCHEHFLALKREENVLDFHDLEQMTLEILENPQLRDRIRMSYDHIFVDECQDVSAIQDAIIQAAHGENCCLFMVGDVKQSIYRFRLADPTLFLHRMRHFPQDEDAPERAIFLQKNFRSTAPILDATNRVFRRTMRADVTELDYLPEDELILGRSDTDAPPVYIELLNRGEEGMKAAEWLKAQADHAAKLIRELLNEPLADGNEIRKYTYRDIVILMPAVRSHGSELADILQSHGIPVYFDGSDDYFALPEILAMRALLDVIDNPMQDIPLLTVLKMTPFLMTDGDLADIRLCKTGRDVPFYEAFDACCEGETLLSERCRAVREQIDSWRFDANVMRLSDLLWKLERETGLFASGGALPEGELRQANMTLLCQKAADYESGGGTTLHGFLQTLDSIRAAGDMSSAKILGEDENLVRIMTIHKSKGLQFPAVILLGMEDPLHHKASKGVHTSSKLGVCVPYYNREINVSRETLMDSAFMLQGQLNEKAERARLLYVAMTRAKERLFIVGGMDGQAAPVWLLNDSSFRVGEAKCMFDWVMQAVIDEYEKKPTALSTGYPQPGSPWFIRVSEISGDFLVDNFSQHDGLWNMLQEVVSLPRSQELDETWSGISVRRPPVPLKTSVSAMLRSAEDVLPVTDTEETMQDKAEPYIPPTQLRLSDAARMPQFMITDKETTGAERGTLVHRALSLLPLDELRSGSMAEGLRCGLDQLISMGCFTPDEAALIRPNMILGYFQSEIGRRMLQSTSVRREWSFTLPLPGGMLMQGVIDCAFREGGGWILVDYKTDRIYDESEFIARYQRQLALYADAIASITGLPVLEQHLYALSINRDFMINA